MTKPNLLSAAFMAAALLIAPAMARQGQPTSHRHIASARTATIAHDVDRQTRVRSGPSGLQGPAERDVWGHWGAYYGPMVVAP